MFKVTQEYESALKHLQLALVDNSPCTADKNAIKFHVAHVFELQGKIKIAKERYEILLRDKAIANTLRADIYRQLGWLYHCSDALGEKNTRISIAIQCLQQAIQADPFSGQTLYLLGRCYASIGKVHDAFISYRNSVEKSEGNADTWCSIGVLYQQQSQPMDALQAYICAVQLDKSHSAAWANLGILYETCGQARDAYACYLNSSRGLGSRSLVEEPAITSKSTRLVLPSTGMNPNLTQRINFLQTHLSNGPMPSITNTRRTLLSIEEAWNLPISAEMSSRQQQQNSQQSRTGSQGFQKTYNQTPQGPPPPYPSPGGPNKRFKTESGEQKPTTTVAAATAPPPPPPPPPQNPPFYLSQQQLQLLQNLQQNVVNLNAQQQSVLQQLQHQYRLMQQHQQQLRNQRQTVASPVTSISSSQVPAFNGTTASQTNGTPTAMPTPKLVQPSLQPPVPTCMSLPNASFNELDVSEEELQDLLSQKGLATTLAENLLKQFGSDEIDIKEESNLESNTLSSGPFSPSNTMHTESGRGDTKDDIKDRIRSPLHDSILTVKNEIPWDMDSYHSEKRPDTEYSINMDAKTILELCKGEGIKGEISNSLISDNAPPPAPPDPPSHKLNHQQLLPPAPSVFLENKKHAFSPQLQEFCLKHPIAVVRGLASALKLDLGLFSTKTLVEANPDHSVEVRTQYQQPSDENWDPQSGRKVWACVSHRSHTTIARYAQYQASSFKESLKEERDKATGTAAYSLSDSDSKDSSNFVRRKNKNPPTVPPSSNVRNCNPQKTLKFGTNVDLSDERKWRPQLQELMKLPAFARVVSAGNMLSHVGHVILGMNTVQLYMKVPGSRTPGHQENNNFCSININIGPGDCEWFAVPDAYWGAICSLYLRKGPAIWFGQYQLAIERYEWNKLQSYKSIVPMLHLSWNLARNIKVSDPKLFAYIKKCLLRTLRQCSMILEFVRHKNVEVKFHGRGKNEASHYCGQCEIEVFNILFIREQEKRHVVHCMECARKQSPNLEGFVCLEEYSMEELTDVYDNFVLHPVITTGAEVYRLPS
ncbi:JmjC domain, hydroxylase [Popillia japonica]